MSAIILKSISAENYMSAAEGLQFTTESDSIKKEYQENTFLSNETMYNKVSVLYGANGSGKTVFCKILKEIQRQLFLSPLATVDIAQLRNIPRLKDLEIGVAPFAFDTAYKDKPTKFSIDIVIDEVTYHYEFSVQGNEIIKERLTKKNKRTETLLDRTSPSFQDITLRSELKSFNATKNVVKPESLCLPVAAMLNNDMANKIVSAISEIHVVNMAHTQLDPLNTEETFSEERLAKYTKILQKADPTLRKIDVNYEEEEIKRPKGDTDDFENREVIMKRMRVGITPHHAVFENGEETTSEVMSFFNDESLGTVKLFTALPYLFDVLENGGVLVMDEIENGLHLSLVKEIIAMFHDESRNVNNAQLICTSHQPLLVSENFRRDQVWIMSKTNVGISTLLRVSDLKNSRAKVNLANRIIEDAFGHNPQNFFDMNT